MVGDRRIGPFLLPCLFLAFFESEPSGNVETHVFFSQNVRGSKMFCFVIDGADKNNPNAVLEFPIL